MTNTMTQTRINIEMFFRHAISDNRGLGKFDEHEEFNNNE
jgi:hypothetical protein